MEIEQGKITPFREFAQVRFDSHEELYRFGSSAPINSFVHHQWLNYMSRGIWPGKSWPERFPAEIRIPNTVLARVAGNLMLRGAGHEDRADAVEGTMLRTISDYLSFPGEIDEEEPYVGHYTGQ